MNTTLRKITNECYENENNKFYKKVGNYEIRRDLGFIIHKYYGNTICLVDLNKKQFSLYNYGYYKYPLTTAQLNYLEKFYKEKGYKLKVRC